MLNRDSLLFRFLNTYGDLKIYHQHNKHSELISARTDTCEIVTSAVWGTFIVSAIIGLSVLLLSPFAMSIAEAVAQYHYGFNGLGSGQIMALGVCAVSIVLFSPLWGPIVWRKLKPKKVVKDKPSVVLETVLAKAKRMCVEIEIK